MREVDRYDPRVTRDMLDRDVMGRPEPEVFGNPEAMHLYEVEVRGKYGRHLVRVHATSRSQAERICEDHNYETCSVNMIG